MSFIRKQNLPPDPDPNGPTGPAGPGPCPTGHPGTPGSTGFNNIPSGTGVTCAPNIPLPNGNIVTIPYTGNGWYYNITIPPMPKKVAKVKPNDGRDGCDCVRCKEFYPFAEPNQEDGTLICFACRNGY